MCSSPLIPGRELFHISNTGVGVVRPLQLDGVVPYLLCFPGTDIANFTIVLVVPSLSWDGISDGFTQFMGTGRRNCIKHSQTTHATVTIGIGHYSVKDLSVCVVVIPTELPA